MALDPTTVTASAGGGQPDSLLSTERSGTEPAGADAASTEPAGAEPPRGPGQRLAASLRAHPERWIIAAALLVRLPLVFTGLAHTSDIWRQSDTASMARNFWSSGYHLFFPQIDWGGAGPGYVESEFPAYPFAVALLYRLGGGEHVALGKALSLALTGGTLAAFWGLARRSVGRTSAVAALAFFAVSPIALRYSTAFMPEATVLFFTVLALLLFTRWVEEDRFALLVGAGLATSMALLAKPTAIQLGAVLAIVLVRDRGWRALSSLRLWAVAVVAAVPAALWTVHARDLHLTYGNTFGVISGGDRKFATLDTFVSPEFYTGVTRTEVVWLLAVGAVPLFVLGLVVAVRRRRPTVLLAGAVVIPAFYVIVAKYSAGPQGIQYHVFALPYAALAVGLGVEVLAHHIDADRRAGRSGRARLLAAGGVGCAALVLLAGAGAYALLLRPDNEVLTSCAAAVVDAVPAGDLVVVSSPYASAADGYEVNYQEPVLFYFSGRRGWSLAADDHDPAALDARNAEGARWFVAYDRGTLDAAPALTAHLDDVAEQVGPGLDAGCGIWRLPAPAPPSNTGDDD